MAFGGFILTNNGRNALAKAQLSGELKLSHISVGSGKYSGSYNDITVLKNKLFDIPISNAEVEEGVCTIVADFTNINLDEGYYLREIGIFAESNGKEILYAYDNSGDDAEYIPNGDGAATKEKRFRFIITVGDAINITLSASSALYLTQQEFEEQGEIWDAEIEGIKEELNKSAMATDCLRTSISDFALSVEKHGVIYVRGEEYLPEDVPEWEYDIPEEGVPLSYFDGFIEVFKSYLDKTLVRFTRFFSLATFTRIINTGDTGWSTNNWSKELSGTHGSKDAGFSIRTLPVFENGMAVKAMLYLSQIKFGTRGGATYGGIISAENNVILSTNDSNTCAVRIGYRNSTEGWAISPNDTSGSNMRLGSINYKFNAVYASTGTIQTSDKNVKDHEYFLKENENARKLILGTKPVAYKLKDGESGRTHFGAYAQDIEELMKSIGMSSLDFAGFIKALKEKSEDEYTYGLRYEEFIAPLISVVQQEVSRLDQLEKENIQMKQQLSDLSKELQEMRDLLK